jgi:hypothetical protein
MEKALARETGEPARRHRPLPPSRLLARHPSVREELQRLANEMERDVGAFERQEAAETDKLAG